MHMISRLIVPAIAVGVACNIATTDYNILYIKFLILLSYLISFVCAVLDFPFGPWMTPHYSLSVEHRINQSRNALYALFPGEWELLMFLLESVLWVVMIFLFSEMKKLSIRGLFATDLSSFSSRGRE